MREEDLEIALKVVIVGNGAVGKSSMIQRYCRGTFTRDYKKTIGVDFLERQIECNGEDVRLMLWDTAGQEEFDAITKAYYRGAQACVLAFSTTDRDSFEAIHSWKIKVEDECGKIPTVIVQNKIDLIERSQVDPQEVDMLARSMGCKLICTSVKDDVNVNNVFRYLATRCLMEIQKEEQEYMSGNGVHQTYTIGSFGGSPYHQHNNRNPSTTIKLRSGKVRQKKKNIFKNSCVIP